MLGKDCLSLNYTNGPQHMFICVRHWGIISMRPEPSLVLDIITFVIL